MAGSLFVFSTLSAVTELFVTVAVYRFLHQAYYRDRFLGGLLAFALTYEVLVNVAYMTYRLVAPSAEHTYSAGMKALLAFHGLLSLVMLIGLIALAVAAFRQHRRGVNLIRQLGTATAAFAVLWGISIITGEIVYVVTYLL